LGIKIVGLKKGLKVFSSIQEVRNKGGFEMIEAYKMKGEDEVYFAKKSIEEKEENFSWKKMFGVGLAGTAGTLAAMGLNMAMDNFVTGDEKSGDYYYGYFRGGASASFGLGLAYGTTDD